VVPALTTVATKATDWRFRLQAMATLDGMDSIDQATITTALNDKDPNVRAHAIRMSERWLGQPGNPLQALILKKMDDPSWTVRRQLAASIGEMPKEARLTPIVTMLRKYGNDDVTVDAAISSIAGQEADAVTMLITDPGTASRPVEVPRTGPSLASGRAGTVVPGLESNAEVRTQTLREAMAKPGADAIAQLASATMRSRNAEAAQKVITLALDTSKPAAQRLAILEGASTGVGGGGRGGGGQAGVLGGGGGGGRGRGGRGAAQTLTLTAEPTALITLSNGGGDFGTQAKKIVAAVTWPGKPAPKVEPISRTPEQQARYDAGQKLYAQKCAGCHKDEGQGGAEAVALAGSRWVNGQTATLVRIMTAGKEGAAGLMPPLGKTMSDDELASVLTYVRGSFGNRANPVQPAEVKETRLMYSYRKTPWSDQELQSSGRGGRGGGN